jgi:glutaminyl-tRNA synthetase
MLTSFPSQAPKASTSSAPAVVVAESPDDMFAKGWLSKLHRRGGNEQKIPARMEEHLAATGGKVFTRFPPEPNGYLHVRPRSSLFADWLPFQNSKTARCSVTSDETNLSPPL